MVDGENCYHRLGLGGYVDPLRLMNRGHRRSIRLRGYDYSRAGMYYVTICTQNRTNLFGQIVGADSISAPDVMGNTRSSMDDAPYVPNPMSFSKMVLNNAGEMIDTLWKQTINDYSHIKSDKYIIMPNHFHCIIEIDVSHGIANRADGRTNRADMESAPTVGYIVQSFKRNTTIKYIAGVKSGIYPPFNGRVWQRNYYEHIIRDEQSYQQIANYIINNPARWENDELNIQTKHVGADSISAPDSISALTNTTITKG